jgi:hypothetical protein
MADGLNFHQDSRSIVALNQSDPFGARAVKQSDDLPRFDSEHHCEVVTAFWIKGVGAKSKAWKVDSGLHEKGVCEVKS